MYHIKKRAKSNTAMSKHKWFVLCTSNSKRLLHYSSTKWNPVDLPAFILIPATNYEASLQHVLPNKYIQCSSQQIPIIIQ